MKGFSLLAVLHPPINRQKANKAKSTGFMLCTIYIPSRLCNEKEEGSGITRRIWVVSMKRDPAAFIRQPFYPIAMLSHARTIHYPSTANSPI